MADENKDKAEETKKRVASAGIQLAQIRLKCAEIIFLHGTIKQKENEKTFVKAATMIYNFAMGINADSSPVNGEPAKKPDQN